MSAVFDRQATRYDAWYDSPTGASLFAQELDAIRPLLTRLPRPWIEVGTGTGRFAAALHMEMDVDPALAALRLARGRALPAVAAVGEALPFANASLGAVLFALTLCFVVDPLATLREARRALLPGGGVHASLRRPCLVSTSTEKKPKC